MMLEVETIAAIPGMVGGMLLQLEVFKEVQHNGGWIKALLKEVENKRMHLMTMVELVKPNWHERFVGYLNAVQSGNVGKVLTLAIAIDY
ncbi:Alternative oxidase 3 [Spatholobus suberectus]|nr:Alternative oxidase 3 [Spatholobus suberectus]